MPRFYRWFFQASQLEPYVHVASLLYVPHYWTIAFFDHLKHIWCGSTDHKAHHYVACSTPVTSSLVDPGISLSTPCSSSVQVQASHLYKTTGKITLLCILMFMLHSSKWWGMHSLNLVCSISLWMQCLKYINISTLSEDLLHVFIVWFYNLQQDMTGSFIFSTFTYRPTSFVATNKWWCVLIYSIYVFVQ
jgi:hypothetical protein